MKDGFCSAPWNTIYISPNGRIDNCCISQNMLGNIEHDDIQHVISGTKHQKIKENILKEGILPDGCLPCKNNAKVTTLKDHFNNDLFKHVPERFYENTSEFQLRFLDLRWRNTCNFACVYCGPELSSSWMKELNILQPIDNGRIDRLKKFVEPRLNEIEMIYLAGGEPLLVKDNEWLLEKVLDVNPKCTIQVNTNFSHINNRIYDLLMKFENVAWILSLESMGSAFEYTRTGSKWTQMHDNLLNLKEKLFSNFGKNHHQISTQMVYCSLSVFRIVDCARYMNEKFYVPWGLLNMTYVWGGSGKGWLDPRNLHKSVLIKAKDLLKYEIAANSSNNLKKEFNEKLIELLNILETPLDPGNSCSEDEFYKQLTESDRRTNLDSKKIFPELYETYI